MNIKTHLSILLAGFTAAASWVSGGPLVQSEIAKDAKWLVHVDMEGVMASSFSGIGVAKLKEAIAKENDSKVSIDVDMVLSEIKSVTAYGASFDEAAQQDSVLVLKTGKRLQAIFDGFVAQQELDEEGGSGALKRIEDKPFPTFLVEGELYLAFPHPHYAIASKSFERIEQAYAVIDGKSANLSAAKDKLVLNSDQGFFLLVTANGMDDLKNVPPQARMLQKTKGGQLSIGEVDGDFRANVMLTTSNNENSMKLFRIVQGLLALASFTQVENQSMMEIVDSVDVKQGNDFVAIDFRYPVDRLVELLEKALGELGEDWASKKHS